MTQINAQTRKHLILKAISWQTLGLVTTLLVTYTFTGSIATSWGLTLSLTGAGLVMYILHEKLWARFLFNT